MGLTTRQREWVIQMELRLMRHGNWFPNTSGETRMLYMGRDIGPDWPTEEMMDADFRQWELEDTGRLDTADPKTFDGWVKCADGRTLWEYANDGGKP